MSKYIENIQRPLLWMIIMLPLILLMSCEDFEEQIYLMSDQEVLVCERLADTLSYEITAADLRFYGPAWIGSNIESALESTERIGATWYDDDLVIEPDVFVFIDGSDTVAALQFIDFVYDETTEQVDSIQIVYMYNPAGSISFDSLSVDTILVENSHTATAYIDFSQGLVSAGSDWNISIDGAVVQQNSTSKVARLENVSLLAFSTAPLKNYVADISGFDLAINYLSSDSVYLTATDSLLIIKRESDVEAGYMLWDRQGLGEAEIIFNASDYMTIALWDESGQILEPLNESLSLELIAYCHDLKTRMTYDLGEETYLIQFLPHEQMTEHSFRLVIVEGE